MWRAQERCAQLLPIRHLSPPHTILFIIRGEPSFALTLTEIYILKRLQLVTESQRFGHHQLEISQNIGFFDLLRVVRGVGYA